VPVTGLHYLAATDLLVAIRSQQVSASEAVSAHIARIEALNPSVNAVVSLRADAALAEAAALDLAQQRGEPGGALHGLPVTIKDSIEVAGLPATCGAPALRDHRPVADAAAVARLRAAGAIILGKTNLPPYAADFQTCNELFGRTSNPYALDRSPSGSSGGSAVSLAAGFAAAELGSDLSGSLRLPAHACGIASLKPSFGIVPLAGSLSGPPQRTSPVDVWVVGPMARTVADLELLMSVIAGPTDADAVGWQLSLHLPSAGRQLRVALWLDEAFCPVSTDVRRVLEHAAAALDSRTGVVVEQARPTLDAEPAFLVHCALMFGEMSAGLPDDVYEHLERRAGRARRPGLDNVSDLQASGITSSHRDWLRASEERRRLRDLWASFFCRYDALLCPVAPSVAPLHDVRRLDQRTEAIDGRDYPALQHSFWASLASLAYLPAATVPVGQDPHGLPVGMQVIGPWLGDLGVLRVARLLEAVTGGFQPPPLVNGAFRPGVGIAEAGSSTSSP
jgi:amidase